jgi:hypothetical protein
MSSERSFLRVKRPGREVKGILNHVSTEVMLDYVHIKTTFALRLFLLYSDCNM